MDKNRIEDFVKGWFVGNFKPSLYITENVEVAVKNYKKGDYEDFHYHKIATEITCIIKGTVRMNGVEYTEGDVIVIEPNEGTDFESLTDDTVNVVVKIPGAKNDKYIGKPE